MHYSEPREYHGGGAHDEDQRREGGDRIRAVGVLSSARRGPVGLHEVDVPLVQTPLPDVVSGRGARTRNIKKINGSWPIFYFKK